MSDDATTRPRPGLEEALRAASEDGLKVCLRLVFSESCAGPAPPMAHALAPGPARSVKIGRKPGPGPALAIPFDSWSSRHHATVTLVHLGDGPGVMVEDQGSQNGTFIDGARVRHREVARPGQLVRVGGSVFVVGFEPPERRAAILAEHRAPAGLVLESWPSVALWGRLAAIAASDDAVLLLGELGTGKSILAEHLHALSPRRDGPFVRYNASALPPNLEEATLFGVVAGFIPTVKKKSGLLETAAGGTLFLDELSEIPLAAQVKLLDAFDPRAPTYYPVGSDTPRSTRCRLVTATNRDPFALIEAGEMRHDLLSRVVVAQLTVPPLRERREDILPLFWQALGEVGVPTDLIPRAELAEALLLSPWSENVRGLRALAKRLGHGEQLTLELIAQQGSRGSRGSGGSPSGSAASTAPSQAPEARQATWPLPPEGLLELLERHDLNVSQVADTVGRRRETVARAISAAFGKGGKPTVLKALEVYRASGRAPDAESLADAYELWVTRAEDPALDADRRRWRELSAPRSDR